MAAETGRRNGSFFTRSETRRLSHTPRVGRETAGISRAHPQITVATGLVGWRCSQLRTSLRTKFPA